MYGAPGVKVGVQDTDSPPHPTSAASQFTLTGVAWSDVGEESEV